MCPLFSFSLYKSLRTNNSRILLPTLHSKKIDGGNYFLPFGFFKACIIIVLNRELCIIISVESMSNSNMRTFPSIYFYLYVIMNFGMPVSFCFSFFFCFLSSTYWCSLKASRDNLLDRRGRLDWIFFLSIFHFQSINFQIKL